MTTSYEIEEPLSEVELELLDSLLSRKTYRVRPVIDEHSSPAEMFSAAAQLCRDAHAKLDADAIRADDVAGSGGRLSSTEELRDLEEAITAATLTGSVVQAAQAVAMARYAAIDREVLDPDTGFAVPVERPLGHRAEFADTDLAAACQWAPRTASTRLGAAVTACAKTPRLVEAAVAGGVPFWKVSLVASELTDVSLETAALVEGELLGSRGFCSWGYQKLRNTTRALVTRWEADAAKQTRKRTAREATGVWAETSNIPGLSELHAVGPADQIAKIYAAVDKLADRWRKHPEQHAEAHPEHYPAASGTAQERGAAFKPSVKPTKPTLGQLRLDALCDLVTEGCDIDVHLIVNVPFERHDSEPRDDPSEREDSGERAGWADIGGVGLVAPDTVAALVARFGCRMTRALFDADTGVTAQTASAKYEPPPKIREFVQLRDGSCRFPGCSRPAVRCDGDHVQEWPTGDTKGANLAAMCRHHHDAKTKGHWDVELTDDGVCTWISRTGRRYTTYTDTDHGTDHGPDHGLG